MSFAEQLFPFETLSAIIGGRSAIDVPRLQLESLDQAEGFLDCYGFRWDASHQRRELSTIRREALSFIEQDLLLDEPALSLPADIRATEDVRELLLLASRPFDDPLQPWACALLRVMHTLAHCSSYFNERFGPEIRAQVLHRLEAHLSEDEDGTLWLGRGHEDAVALVNFEVKHQKSNRSLAMKLLHKPENVATDVFDRLGVRFVTSERFDVLRVVRYLRVHNVIMFANIKPSRSRNSLVDLDAFKAEVERLAESPELTNGELLDELRRWLGQQPMPPADTHFNLHSSVDYHAIQFTCRQLIRVPNPFSGAHTRFSASQLASGDLSSTYESGPELRFFFPFEVQILDQAGYLASRTGLAAHDIYKARQRETVKERVLGSLLHKSDG